MGKRAKGAKAVTVERDPHYGFRGVPPLPKGALAELHEDTLLTEYEAAAFLRLSTTTLSTWRGRRGHPLKWQYLDNGFVRYRAGAVRAYLERGKTKGGRPRKKPSP